MDLRELSERIRVPSGCLLAGLSGGADSVALTAALREKRDRGELTLQAVHVNHGLRGADSDGDECFVRELCREWQIPLTVIRLDPPAHPGEAWAREERYRAFAGVYARCGADALVLAHHRDDQTETLLLHLLRGAGLDGLCAMEADTERDGMRILRPLLPFSRAELREVLLNAGMSWREDASNASPQYLRNRVRNELLPLMESLAPGASERIAGTAGLLQTDRDTLAWMTGKPVKTDWIPISLVCDCLPGLRAARLRNWLGTAAGICPDRPETERLLKLPDEPVGFRCALRDNVEVQRGYRYLHLLKNRPESGKNQTWTVEECPSIRVTSGRGNPGDGKTAQEFPAEALEGCVIRTRRQGDRIRPFGMTGTMKLQDFLVNRRVEGPWRERIPMLCRDSEVLWVPGAGAGDIPRWNADNNNIRLTWVGELPLAGEQNER